MTIDTPRDWFAGDEVTALMLDDEIRDQFADLIAPGINYTPAWTSSGTAPALLNGTITGRYKLVGKMCDATFKLTAGTTTTYGTGNYMISLPFTAVAGPEWIGQMFIGDSSAGASGYTTTGKIYVSSGASTMGLYAGNTGSAGSVTNTNPQTFANGDRIWGTVRYETA